MKPVIYVTTSIVSSLIFVHLISLSYFDSFNYFELMDFLVIWGMFILPVFLIGGFIAGCVDFWLQEFFKARKYLISLTVFIFVGILCNIYALGHWIRNGWDDGVMEYLILGISGSVLYFHIWLLLNKLAIKTRTNLLGQS
ncbi:hypothetical protein [Sporosarcina sp. HYO08]|uniref:hypothetical protein n=1 Tax=Sporosarcina sp. HYO08 TaxID=1759557 RepID=UPI00079C0A1E|nr:hypothetical protein [Sporosarcina sp. HYO08]KXH87469.1 hypothetical protein AU377_02560 [Sporosarcina sp. HYO08]